VQSRAGSTYISDSALAIGGVSLITYLIAVAHLYPLIPTIAFAYLLLVLALGQYEYVLILAEAGLAEMRALIFELRPESMETEGLVAALNKPSSGLARPL